MRALAMLLSLWTVSALADELPTNLLLKCEGKVSVIFTNNSLNFKDDKFDTVLRLKDGELSDTNSIWLTTKDCGLRNGVIRCPAKSVVALPTPLSGSERRELQSFITRETGEYNFYLETWSFEGPNASGRQTGNSKLRRTGVCTQVGKPIF